MRPSVGRSNSQDKRREFFERRGNGHIAAPGTDALRDLPSSALAQSVRWQFTRGNRGHFVTAARRLRHFQSRSFHRQHRRKVYACGEFGADQFIAPARRRKLSRLQQMALVAARKSFSPGPAAVAPEKICIAIGTGLGSLNDTAAFVENMILKDERAPRPSLFTSSVHNSLASQIAIEMKFSGLNSTPIQREISFETALWQAATELALGRAEFALVGAADELNQYQLAAGMRWGWWHESSPEIRPFAGALKNRQRPQPGEGGTVVTLGRAEKSVSPLAFVSAIRIGRSENKTPGPRRAGLCKRWNATAFQLATWICF
jgi:hypothetical protein